MSNEAMLALMWLISRAELTGSRGRCRHYGVEEPMYADYDWTIYTDDPEMVKAARSAAEVALRKTDYGLRIVERKDGFTLHSETIVLDINCYPTARRAVYRLASALMMAGGFGDKNSAWQEAKQRCNYDDGSPTNIGHG